MNVLDLARKRVVMRKVSSTKGGEWHGPCPECGGKDRFHVWPEENGGAGSWWCRGCGKAGDGIQFMRDFEGISFREACDRLQIDPGPYDPASSAKRKDEAAARRPSFTPLPRQLPDDAWQEKADRFISWSQAHLERNRDVRDWLTARGIDWNTARDYRLGFNPGENGRDLYRPRVSWGLPEVLKDNGRPKMLWLPIGLVIPYIQDGIVYRVRIRRPEGEPRYYFLPGSSSATMVLGRERRAFVIVESELDALAVVSSTDLSGGVSMGTAAAKPDAEAFDILRGAIQILNALDYDKAGKDSSSWWREHFSRCDRWPVPQGKDPGEAAQMGISLKGWIESGLVPAVTVREDRPAPRSTRSVRRSEPSPDPMPERTDLPEGLIELRDLLKANPGVVIINHPDRFTVLRYGKHVRGRINALVFTVPTVRDYILQHPACEIDGTNLIV